MPSREELNQLYSDSHKLKQVIADNNALRKQLAQQAEMVEQCMVCMNDNADEAKRLESVIVELQAALAEPSEPVAWTESAIDEYLSGYSLIGDDGDYTPTDDEKFVIKDAIIGFMSPTPETKNSPRIEDIQQAVARGWCSDRNLLKRMDSDLATDIAYQVAALLFTHPAPSKPAPLPELTDEEIELIGNRANYEAPAMGWNRWFARAIEQAVWEKMNGK